MDDNSTRREPGPLAAQFTADEVEALIQTAGEAWAYAWDPPCALKDVVSQRQASLAERAWTIMGEA